MANGLASQIMELRTQGLPDNMVLAELQRRGYPAEQAQAALQEADSGGMGGMDNNPQGGYPQPSGPTAAGDDNIYERIEEIAESLIDEKWDELLAEVKKIIEWKEKIEERQMQLQTDLAKLKEDFRTLHQGVLGRLETYDERMQDVGTELKAVGKVFKDVIPEFVENVKELRSIKEEMKK